MAGYVVEIVGNIGAGKSTIAWNLPRERITVAMPSVLLRTCRSDANMLAQSRFGIVWDALLASLKEPRLAWDLARYLYASSPSAWRFRQILIMASWTVRLARIRSTLKDNLVLEEWIIHRLAALPPAKGEMPDPSSAVKRALYGRIDAIIHVRCERQVAFQRMRNRSATAAKIESLPEKQARREHELLEQLIERGIRAVRQAGVPILTINSTETLPERNAEIISQWLT